MHTQSEPAFTKSKQNPGNSSYLIITICSLIALVMTFLLSAQEIESSFKVVIFAAIIMLYLAVCAAIYLLREKTPDLREPDEISEPFSFEFNADVENRLLALEEAHQFFGASLKPADMFRLVASRVNELIPFAACALFIVNETNEKLKAVFADGKNSDFLKNAEAGAVEGNVGKTFFSREPQFDEKLFLEKSAMSAGTLAGLDSAIAVPLFRGDEVFGVLQLYGDAETRFDKNSLQLLEAVGTRIAPLFLSSFAYERSVSNALTDNLTNLPNERAFFLVLENQIAETQRYREDRPLTVLAVDLKDFAELNRRYGHATGDRFLQFAGDVIKTQLRQMDFMARSASDEFLIILPTASENIALEITERIERAFVAKPFAIAADENVTLELNFGAATFGSDGETAPELLKSAVLRKRLFKLDNSGNVLKFPQEYLN